MSERLPRNLSVGERRLQDQKDKAPSLEQQPTKNHELATVRLPTLLSG